MFEKLKRHQQHFLAVNRLDFAATGKGGMIFLPGFMSNRCGEKALAFEALCRDNCINYTRFDYFGHGDSSGDFQEGTIGHWLEDVLAIIDSTTGKQVLIGSSMGGWLMTLAALKRPERIAGLVGIAPALDFMMDLIEKELSKMQLSTLNTQGYVEIPSQYDKQPYVFTKKFIEEARSHLLLANHIALTMPVRLVHGMQDADVPWQTSIRMAEKIATEDCQVHLIKDAHHRLSRPQDIRLVGKLALELWYK